MLQGNNPRPSSSVVNALGRFLRLIVGETVDPARPMKMLYLCLFENWRRICGVVSALDSGTLAAYVFPAYISTRHTASRDLRSMTRVVLHGC